MIVVKNLDEAYSLADRYACEHVQILTENPREALDKMKSYGAPFLGELRVLWLQDHRDEPRPPYERRGQILRAASG